MYHSKKKMMDGGKMKKRTTMKHGGTHDGNASARREKMKEGGMKKTARTKANMGRMMYKKGGKAGMYKEDMPKAKPC